MDAGFDSKQIRHKVNRKGIKSILKTHRDAQVDKQNIKEILEDDLIDIRVTHGWLNYDGIEHDVSWIYQQKENEQGKYSILLTTNGHVSPDSGMGLARQYDQRMEIETTYQTIKTHFLPTTASKDYRIRLLFFVIGAIMYNVWRLSNFVVRDVLEAHLGDAPPIPAGEIVELVAMFLFDPGG